MPAAEPPEEERGRDLAGSPPSREEMSLWSLAAIVVRSRAWVFGSALFFGAASLSWGLALPSQWSSEASFTAHGGADRVGQLSSLAAQFGLDLSPNADEESPEFYAELIRSAALLTRIADNPIEVSGERISTLASLKGVEGASAAEIRERTVEWLQEEVISVNTARETGVVTVVVRTRWPDVSAQVAAAVINEVNRFNNDLRRTRASAEREHIEEQMELAREELLAAERALRMFLEGNRQIENSPELFFERDRLQREVNMRQDLYASLNQAFQQARISEVRNTPVINIIQLPGRPVIPDERRLLLRLLLGALIGALFGLMIGLARQVSAPDGRVDREAWLEVNAFLNDLVHLRWRRAFFGASR